jgi:hypothetical protein
MRARVCLCVLTQGFVCFSGANPDDVNSLKRLEDVEGDVDEDVFSPNQENLDQMYSNRYDMIVTFFSFALFIITRSVCCRIEPRKTAVHPSSALFSPHGHFFILFSVHMLRTDPSLVH